MYKVAFILNIKTYIPTSLSDVLTTIGIYLIIIGLFLSNAMKSIGIIAVCVSILFNNQSIKNSKIILKNALYLSAICIACVYIFSIFRATDYSTYWNLANSKIAYLFFPLAIYNFSPPVHFWRTCLWIAVTAALFQSAYSLYYLFFYSSETIAALYSTGNIIDTFKIHHVQISILYSLLVLILIYLFINENEKKAHKIIYGILAAWFFFMLHILAVRSGILLSYFFIIFYLITSVKKISRKQFALALIGIVIGITMLCTFKTVQQRFHYLKYDYQQYLENKHTAIEYTDSRRLISIGVGLEIIQENKWLGCGLANINRACAEIYRKKYPTFAKDYYYLPHSQFIFFIACFGIPLGLLVCLLFIFPATYFLRQKKYVLFFSYLGLLLFATWDAWLGTLFGNSLYLLLIGAGIKKQWN